MTVLSCTLAQPIICQELVICVWNLYRYRTGKGLEGHSLWCGTSALE